MKIRSIPKTRILLPVLGAVALLGLGGAALAKPDGGRPGAEGPRGGLCAKLECSDQQKEELRAVASELRADTKGDREAIGRLGKELAAELAKAKPDEAAMKATMAKIANHERELRERAFDALMELHALLDAEQRAKLAEAIEHRGLRGLMHGGGRRHGKG